MAPIVATINHPRTGAPLVRLGAPSKRASNYGDQNIFAATGPTRAQDRLGYLIKTGSISGVGKVVLIDDDQERVTDYPASHPPRPSAVASFRAQALAAFVAHVEAKRRRNATDHRGHLRDYYQARTGSPEAAARVKVKLTQRDERGAAYEVTVPIYTALHLGLLSTHLADAERQIQYLGRYLGRWAGLGCVRQGRSLVRFDVIIPALPAPDAPAFEVVGGNV